MYLTLFLNVAHLKQLLTGLRYLQYPTAREYSINTVTRCVQI